MFKIVIFFFFVSASAKLTVPSYEYILFEQFNSVQEYPPLDKPLPAVNAWVLSLDGDVGSMKLRAATSEEAREVFGTKADNGPNYRQPRIDSEPSKPESTTDVTKDNTEGDEKALLADIMRVINKFILTTNSEPDVHVGEDADKGLPTLKLYFKGVHTSLVVRAEGRQWHYIIGPPSLFPDWFYQPQPHEVQRDGQGAFVNVPRDVAVEFYKALLHMLTMFLSFPV